jgi:hypothetical protein
MYLGVPTCPSVPINTPLHEVNVSHLAGMSHLDQSKRHMAVFKIGGLHSLALD